MLSGNAAARTDADFAIAEGEARAGDAVHFSITGATGQYTYELEIGDLDVVEDTVATGNISGEFTLPHLGNSQRTAVVKAVIRESRHKATVTRKLRYLGRALPPVRPDKPAQGEKPAPDPAPEPVAQAPATPPSGGGPPAAAPSPGPSSSPAAAQQDQQAVPASRTAARRRSGRRAKRRKAPTRLTTSLPSTGDRRAGHRRRSPHRRGRKRGRPAPRTAPLFDGVPERGIRGGTPGGRDRYAAPNAIVPAALVSATRTTSTGDGGLGAAILVPGLMGIAALALTGTALQRRRRLRRPA